MTDIRPFDWRDIALLRRLGDRGACPNAQMAYTRGVHVLQNALLDVFTPNRHVITLVVRTEGSEPAEAIGQCVRFNGRPNAHMTFISPTEALGERSGMSLLEGLASAAGKLGAHHLVADVDEDSPAFEGLRRAGFAIYARQRVWVLKSAEGVGKDALADSWRLETSRDILVAHALYGNLVPALVQSVELPPEYTGRNLVYWSGGEILGYLDLEQGPLGTWIQPYFHPAGERFDELMAGFVAQTHRHRKWPLYVCVRSYQSWMGRILDRMGFEPCADQAVMVKRLTVRLRAPERVAAPNLEGRYPETSVPYAGVHVNKERPA